MAEVGDPGGWVPTVSGRNPGVKSAGADRAMNPSPNPTANLAGVGRPTMPVTARRTALTHAVSQTNETRSTSRSLAKHRKPTKAGAPRAAAAVLSVGLAVGGG